MMKLILFLIIAFVILNIIAYLVLNRRAKSINTPFLSEGVSMEKFYQIMPNESDETIKDIFSAFSTARNKQGKRFQMTYAPYTEHKDVAFSSPYLNITQNGIRLNGENIQNDIHHADTHNIFLFGGSTALGYCVKDEDTIAANLERNLNHANEAYQVFNCGRQSYFSTPESILFQRFLQEGAKIDTVIFMDGLNDLFHNCPTLRNRSRYSEIMERNWEYLSRMLNQQEVVSLPRMLSEMNQYFLARLPVSILWQKFKNKITNELKKKEGKANDRLYEPWVKGVKASDIDPVKVANQVAVLTNTNWNIIRGIAKQYNVNVIFALQPVYYVDTDKEKHLFILKNEHPLWYESYQTYYKELRQANKDQADFLDVSSIFKQVESCPFVDSHHYSPYGNKLIADELAKKFNQTVELELSEAKL